MRQAVSVSMLLRTYGMDFQGFLLNNTLGAVGQLTDPKIYSLKPIQTSKNSRGEKLLNISTSKLCQHNTVLLCINIFC